MYRKATERRESRVSLAIGCRRARSAREGVSVCVRAIAILQKGGEKSGVAFAFALHEVLSLSFSLSLSLSLSLMAISQISLACRRDATRRYAINRRLIVAFALGLENEERRRGREREKERIAARFDSILHARKISPSQSRGYRIDSISSE